MNEMICERKHVFNCRYEIKQSYDSHSRERNFRNCIEIQKPEKFRTSMGFEHLTLR